MKERMQKALSISSLFFATMCLTSCEINSDTPPWQIILIIIGVLCAMLIANYILEYIAIRFAYIFWPACLAYTLILFFMTMNGKITDPFVYSIHHLCLLYLIFPNFDDSIHMYQEISYQYDLVLSDWIETDRKTIKEETPGFLIKLGVIVLIILSATLFPSWFIKDETIQSYIFLFLPFAIEVLISFICSILGVVRLIRYHR